MMMEIYPIPALSDNYIYLCRDKASGQVAAVDPSEAEPVLRFLRSRQWKLDLIFITHHHQDHVGGNLALKAAFGCPIWGPRKNTGQVPGLDEGVGEGSDVAVGQTPGKVLEIPGHTLGAVAYWFESADAVFTGDTLFTLGCGRLFEGTPAQMWESLNRLARLPATTRVYPGHEYTEKNAEFAMSVDPQNEALARRQAEVRRLRAKHLPTVPGTIGEEKETNPFLRAGNVEKFAELRRLKDNF